MQDLEGLVSAISGEVEEANAARGEMLKASADILSIAIQKVKPILSAVGTRPVIAYRVQHHADVNYDGGRYDGDRYKYRCVCLSNGDFGPDKDFVRANSGRYEGKDLALRSDGQLIELSYSGTWSRWQGSSYGYTAEVTVYIDVISAIKDGWIDVPVYLENLTSCLLSAVGKKKKRADSDRQLAQKLSALRELLK
jgi:hypothetical protein